MKVDTILPEEFYQLSKEKQEIFLAERFIQLGKIENFYRHLLGKVRGGVKIEKEEK